VVAQQVILVAGTLPVLRQAGLIAGQFASGLREK